MSTIKTLPTPKETKYTDYLAKFKKEASYFENEITANGKPWPRPKLPDERAYNNWIAEVVDPVTGEYHTNAFGEGAKYLVDMIVRLRKIDGTEVLYSQGQLVGYDSFKDVKTFACEKPEVHLRTVFGHKKNLDPKTNQIKRVTTGPIRVEEVYDMPFTEENADKLWEMKRNRNIQLILKDELSNTAHSLERKGLIAPNDLQTAFEFFKTKPFDYLYNWEYAKSAEQQELLERIEKKYGKNIADELRKTAQPDNQTQPNDPKDPKKVK